MNFEKALESLKRGDRVVRAGWHDRYLRLSGLGEGPFVDSEELRQSLGNFPHVLAHELVRAGLESSTRWLPTADDLFAEDWRLLGGGGASVTQRDESSASPGETIKVGPPSR